MGLDSFWQIDEGTPERVKEEFSLRGDGLFTNKGVSCFRGKVYDTIIEPLVGFSLYQEVIENKTILEMNEKIQGCCFEKATELAVFDLGQEEWKYFQRMWDAHAKAGHYLAGCGRMHRQWIFFIFLYSHLFLTTS